MFGAAPISSSRLRYSALGFGSLLAVALAALSQSGCVSPQIHPEDMTAAEKAREINVLRKKAQLLFDRYLVEHRVELLEEAAELEKRTTEIAPSTCPTCFREYGLALSSAGRHYDFEYVDAKREHDDRESAGASAGELQTLRETMSVKREKSRSCLARAVSAYINFFNHRDAKDVSPEDVSRVVHDLETLQRWDEALLYLRHLEQLLGGRATVLQREAINDLKRRYQRQIQMQRERGAAGRDGASEEG